MESKKNILVNKNDFINNTHFMLDNIHGRNVINTIFKDLEQDVLNELIIIYKNTFLERYYSIHSSLKKNKIFENKPYDSIFITSMYICAMQHFI